MSAGGNCTLLPRTVRGVGGSVRGWAGGWVGRWVGYSGLVDGIAIFPFVAVQFLKKGTNQIIHPSITFPCVICIKGGS